MHISGKFSSEAELKEKLDFLYEQSRQNKVFHGLLEVAFNDVTITTAIHNIKSNQGAKTGGIDGIKIDKYLQMNRTELINLIKENMLAYKPKPVRRVYIEKSNGKKRPLGIPTILDRIIQECIRIVIEPIVEARFYQHSYGFRPYRATKHAIRQIITILNNSKQKVKPCIAIEGDIKGYFDNINHRLLLKKVWNIGIRDKRILAIIKEMLKAGYIENDFKNATEMGTPQGGIISPLLANIYLNDFDWYVSKHYLTPDGKCKEMRHERERLIREGVRPKYLIRYADDWIILTDREQEARRFLNELKGYFKQRFKLELSEDKTVITDMRASPIQFLGYLIKVDKARKTPANIKDRMVTKVYPDPKKVRKQIRKICEEIKTLKYLQQNNLRASKIEHINSMIIGAAEYWKTAICSKTYNKIDYNIRECSYNAFRDIYGNKYKNHRVPLDSLTNRQGRHKGYKTDTFAIIYDNYCIGLTYAALTHSQWEMRNFNQKMTPYTEEGRKLYQNSSKGRKLPLDRPTIHEVDNIDDSYKDFSNNFEYYMNREYAYNRDKGMCKCCKTKLTKHNRHCHHLNESLPIDKINKVPNLVWICWNCDMYIHGKTIDKEIKTNYTKNKIRKYRAKLNAKVTSDALTV